MPPSIRVMLATSMKVRPPISTGRGSSSANGRSPASALSIAFSAVQGRAEWPLTPWKTMRPFRLPRQPAWIVLSVGSSRIASSASWTIRDRSNRSGSGLCSAGSSSFPNASSATSISGSTPASSSARASSSMTARPPFMSLAPRPTTAPFSTRPGMFS
jgi:hypothetical protein